ncbi:speckle-type POZ protein-like [Belonocnema kinseyi]|uniref:speckle-type POZ protein-like n=1 Tax=Belonocnema kinseyi TaxID=2817044 RepID=UPI00143CC406|nr:speckle-type POZ protein-like [Belonocnema kinseyi]
MKREIEEIKTDFEKFKPLLNNKMYSDIGFLFDYEKYPAHKLVLAVNSIFYQTQFSRQDSISEIKVDDINPKVFYELLIFMYTGTVEYMDEITCRLFNFAVKYGVLDLDKLLMSIPKVNLSIENVISNFLDSQDDYMQGIFFVFIVKNIETIMTLGKFTELLRIAPEFLSDILVEVSLFLKSHKKDESWQISKNLHER